MKTMKLLSAIALVLICFAAVRPAQKVTPAKATAMASTTTEKEAAPLDDFSKNDLFQAFLKEFKYTDLPYELSIETLTDMGGMKIRNGDATAEQMAESEKKESKSRAMSKKYGTILPDLKSGYFSRMGPSQVEPLVVFAVGNDHVAVVYSLKQAFRGDLSVKLATFNAKGKLVDNIFIASSEYGQVETCSITKNLVVNKVSYEAKWEHDPAIKGYDNNKIVDYEMGESTSYVISKEGQIMMKPLYMESSKVSRS